MDGNSVLSVVFMLTSMATFEVKALEIPWNVTFYPEHLTVLKEDQFANFTISINFANGTESLSSYKRELRRAKYRLIIENVSPKHMEIGSKTVIDFRFKDVIDGFSTDVEVKGVQVGMAKVLTTISGGESSEIEDITALYDVHVLLVETIWSHIFRYGVLISTVLNTVAFACCLDLHVVKKRFTRPWGIIIGFFFQYVFMPSVGINNCRIQ